MIGHKSDISLLAVCSTVNFRDFTRRATIEGIKNEIPDLDVLLYTSLKNIFRKKTTIEDIKFLFYHFWIPDKFKKYNIFGTLEHKLRGLIWRKRVSLYGYVFFTDPNQAWLLPYITKSRVIYLIRDPNVLQNFAQKENERLLLNRADLVLATSINLTYSYLKKFHGIEHDNIHYWPNCVDIKLWKANDSGTKGINDPVIGIAGNFGDKRTDYELIDYVTSNTDSFNFMIAGRIDYEDSKDFWDKILAKSNVKYLGNIPYEELPAVVSGWDVGLVTDKIDEYSSFMHHNKVYQYLALGIPVVSMKIHNDYAGLYPCVHLAENYQQFVEAISVAFKQTEMDSFRISCIEKARINSSEVRALEFLKLTMTI